jgi:hypothetical protein
MTRTTVDLMERCLVCEAVNKWWGEVPERPNTVIRVADDSMPLRETRLESGRADPLTSQAPRCWQTIDHGSAALESRTLWVKRSNPLRENLVKFGSLALPFVPSLASEAALQGVGTKKPGVDHVYARFHESVSS